MSLLAAIAIPVATAAATQLVQEIAAHRPFASFLDAATGGATTGELPSVPLMTDIGTLMENLRSAIADRLAAAGIDPATSFDLSSDSGGHLVVGDHPLRDKIAAALDGDPAIRSTFQQISATRSMLEAAQRHLEFAQRYALDPFTALPERVDKLPFSLSFANGQLS
jgi:hypothetical protein